jgi:hypothetical protein
MGRCAGRYLAILLETKMWHPKAAGDAAPDRASNLEANCARVEPRIEAHRIGRGPDGMFRELFLSPSLRD